MSSTFRLAPARSFTDYRADCIIEENLKKRLGVTTDAEYKKALEKSQRGSLQKGKE